MQRGRAKDMVSEDKEVRIDLPEVKHKDGMKGGVREEPELKKLLRERSEIMKI